MVVTTRRGRRRSGDESGWHAHPASLVGTVMSLPAAGSPEALVDAWLKAWAETDAEGQLDDRAVT